MVCDVCGCWVPIASTGTLFPTAANAGATAALADPPMRNTAQPSSPPTTNKIVQPQTNTAA